MTTTQKRKTLMHLAAQYERYLTAEAKLKEAIIASRSVDLEGEPLATFDEIGKVMGITRQSVWAYVRRWSHEDALRVK